VRRCHRADEDAKYAQQLVKEESLRKKEESVNEEDVKLAKQIQREEMEFAQR